MKVKGDLLDVAVHIPYIEGGCRHRVVIHGTAWVVALSKKEAAKATQGFFYTVGDADDRRHNPITREEVESAVREHLQEYLTFIVESSRDLPPGADEDEDDDEDTYLTRDDFNASYHWSDGDEAFIMLESEWVHSGRRPRTLEGEGDYAL